MIDSTSDGPADSDIQRLRRRLSDADSRIAILERSSLHGAIVMTLLVLAAATMLPFFVPRSGEGRTASLWQSFGDDPPSSVPDSGGFWAIPILATVIVMVVLAMLWNGAGSGKLLVISRFLTWAYLIGCLLGPLVLGGEEQRPRLLVTSPAMITFLVGAVLAVGICYTRILANVHEHRDEA